jgi:hypothetical protein
VWWRSPGAAPGTCGRRSQAPRRHPVRTRANSAGCGKSDRERLSRSRSRLDQMIVWGRGRRLATTGRSRLPSHPVRRPPPESRVRTLLQTEIRRRLGNGKDLAPSRGR